MIKGEIIGGKVFQAKLNALSDDIANQIKKTMAQTLAEMDSDVKQSISGGARSGKIYKRGKKGRSHQASAASELPKTDMGGLVSSFAFDTKATGRQIIGTLKNFSKHAIPLEYKPKSQGGRPFMRPLFKKWRPIASERFGVAIKGSIRKV